MGNDAVLFRIELHQAFPAIEWKPWRGRKKASSRDRTRAEAEIGSPSGFEHSSVITSIAFPLTGIQFSASIPFPGFAPTDASNEHFKFIPKKNFRQRENLKFVEASYLLANFLIL